MSVDAKVLNMQHSLFFSCPLPQEHCGLLVQPEFRNQKIQKSELQMVYISEETSSQLTAFT